MPRELGQDLIFLLLGVPSVIMPALVQLHHPTSWPTPTLAFALSCIGLVLLVKTAIGLGKILGGRCAPGARDVSNARGRSNNMAHELLVAAEENSSQGPVLGLRFQARGPGKSRSSCLVLSGRLSGDDHHRRSHRGYAAASAVSRRLFTLSCAACTFAAWRRTI